MKIENKDGGEILLCMCIQVYGNIYVFNVLLPVQFIYGIQVHIHHCSTPGGVLPGIILYGGSTPGTTHTCQYNIDLCNCNRVYIHMNVYTVVHLYVAH